MEKSEEQSNEKKIKVLTISDHPLSPSGVGTQTKYVITGLLDSGRYNVLSLGGAIKHADYTPIHTDQYGEDWRIVPVDGYGNQDTIRSIVRTYKPDILWFMTDPRFYAWLWEIDHEIRPLLPMVYYHVWDNYPYPYFNKKFYESNDVICTISKVTDDIVRTVAPETQCIHMPHAVDTEIFLKKQEAGEDFRKKSNMQDRVLFFWNNRNARRKQSGTMLWWFKEFLDEVGHENAGLIMHTDPKDPNGQDLQAIIEHLDVEQGSIMISTQKIAPQDLASMYNGADCAINISDAEGFGLATLESLACETPIIVNMTGGLQEQVTDGKEWFGIGIEPSSKSVIGSQGVPYIHEDRISKEDFINACKKIYNMTKEERAALGAKGREHVMKNYNFSDFRNDWVKVMDKIYEDHGSWDERKKYKNWRLLEL